MTESNQREGPILLRDWLGCSVRLTKKVTTAGGTKFPEGHVMRVVSHWRGNLSLSDNSGCHLRHVPRRAVDWMEGPK